jgi:hypothetical protein
MKMKHTLFVTGMVILILFSACAGFFDFGEEKIEDNRPLDQRPQTMIEFNNKANTHTVSIFTNSNRDAKITEIKGGQTFSFPWPNSGSYQFYLTYHLTVENLTLPCIPKNGVVIYNIQKEKTTVIEIPGITTLFQPDDLLLDDIYLGIKNNSGTALTLLRGSGIIYPEGSQGSPGEELINNGATGLYKIPKGTPNSSAYTILRGATVINFPAITFQNGYLYTVTVDGMGNVASTGSKAPTLNNP